MRGGVILSKLKEAVIVLYKLNTEGRIRRPRRHPVSAGENISSLDNRTWAFYWEY